MAMLDCKLAVYLGLMSLIPSLQGHGYIKEPPGRSTLWTEFEDGSRPPQIKVNYNHMGLNCGGFAYQWNSHNGACGICGDPVNGIRENEAGGKYASGYISRSYQQGQVIDVAVQITADHKGWFEFRLCPHNNPTVPATQACLDQYLLEQEDGSTRYTWTDFNPALHQLKLKLPGDVTCSQCIIQWKYNTGNSWGCDFAVPTLCAIGYGPQEEFYGCSDVSIAPAESTTPESTTSTTTGAPESTISTTTSAPESTTSTTTGAPESTNSTTTIAPESTTSTTTITPESTTSTTTITPESTTSTTTITPESTTSTTTSAPESTTSTTTITPESTTSTTTSAPESTTSTTTITPESTTSTSPSTSPASQRTTKATTAVKKTTTNAVKVCVAVSPYHNDPGMDSWCQYNCGLGYCPDTHCKCSSPVTSTKSSTLTTLLMSTTSALSQATTTTSETCSYYKSKENLGLAADGYCNMCSRDDSCPPDQCKCDTSLPVLTCTGRGTYSGVINMAAFCQYVCTYSPSTCPQDKCDCTQ